MENDFENRTFKYWRGYGIGVDVYQRPHSVVFEFELAFPVSRHRLERFLRKSDFTWKGLKMVEVQIPDKNYWGITYAYNEL